MVAFLRILLLFRNDAQSEKEEEIACFKDKWKALEWREEQKKIKTKKNRKEK